jgi:hypothetical protein
VPRFSRTTIIAAIDTLNRLDHDDITRFLLGHTLTNSKESLAVAKSDRVNAIRRHLLDNPDAITPEGQNLTDAVVQDLVDRAAGTIRLESLIAWDPPHRFEDAFERAFPELVRALDRDGFTVKDWKLSRTVPEALDLSATDDEVHTLLDTFGFSVTKGHLDQAIHDHSQGHWAAANSQFRTFVESLFDEIAARLAPGQAPKSGHDSRTFLFFGLARPFFFASLNEWDGQGRGFLEGFMRRLHPAGSHPGLSDEEDCTFRLHLVMIVARLMLLRLRTR